MNILIADSGSSKTTWCFCNLSDGSKKLVQTAGINPYYQDEQAIYDMLWKEYSAAGEKTGAIYFYGAGCANSIVNEIVKKALTSFFGIQKIEIESDLMGAARSLCGNQPGVACILGTGSNSCYYDGHIIAGHIFTLGFIFGDDGSGSELGKKLLADVLKHLLPAHLISAFFEEYKVTPDEIMENIYRKPFPNRYAARFSRFIYDNIHEPSLTALVRDEFVNFFRRNVLQYPQVSEVPVHFTGSVAFHFQEILKEVADSMELKTGKIVLDPIDGLVEYHLTKHD